MFFIYCRKLKKWFLLLLTGIQFSCVCSAQPPSLYFEKLNTQNGLSHNKVNCVIQDRRGFMWIGTDDGLNRFDGHNFTIYRNEPQNNSSVSGNIITGLLEDETGVLWITTGDGGLTRYDYRLPPANQFKQYRHLPADSHSIPGNTLNAIIQDDQKKLWLATSGFNLLRFTKETEQFEMAIAGSNRTFLSICTDASGYIWAGGHGGGIFKINPNSLRHFNDARYENLYANLPHAAITSFYRDENNDIWFGSWDKSLYRYNSSSGTETEYKHNGNNYTFVNDEVLCFAKDRNGLLWIGGHYKGLQAYDKKTGKFYLYQHDPLRDGSISDNHINCLLIDKNGVLWLGTNRGLNVINPTQQQFQQFFLPVVAKQPSVLYDLYEDENKNLFIGTNDGLFIKKNGTSKFVHKPLFYKNYRLAVTHFFKDGNTFYIGTDYSLFIYNVSNNTLSLLPHTEEDKVMNQLIESRVVSVIKDSIDGRPVLLVSPYGHYFAYYDLSKQRWVSRLDSTKKIIQAFTIKDNLIHKFLKTSTGQVWLANTTQGLGEWKKDSSQKIVYNTNDPSVSKSLSSNHVYDIVEEKNGNLWISTFGGGLHFYNNTTKQVSHINGSPNLLEGLQTDNNGNVWMIAAGELFRYNPQQPAFTSFHLPDLEKRGGVNGYIYKNSEGELQVSGLNYFISFNPDSVEVRHFTRTVLLTDFKIFDASYSHLLSEKKIVLPYYRNSISISFAAPDYSFSQPPRYAYMLMGANKDWVTGGKDNIANFSNLAGGNYIFKIKVLNDPSGNDPVTTLSIRIVPPFWKRTWFYAICILATGAILYGIYKYRITALKKQQTIRNKIAQDLHDNMGSALSSISVYSQVAKIYNDRSEKKALENVLEKMSATSTEVISEMNDIVWAINPRNDNMEKIFQRMDSFAKPLAAVKGIRLQSDYDSRLATVNLSMEMRKNFYLIFKEAFTNIMKYAEAKNIQVEVKQVNKQIQLTIKDDGKGFDAVSILHSAISGLAGNGLRNMQIRAKEMKGECYIESSTGNGTFIRLSFPV